MFNIRSSSPFLSRLLLRQVSRCVITVNHRWVRPKQTSNKVKTALIHDKHYRQNTVQSFHSKHFRLSMLLLDKLHTTSDAPCKVIHDVTSTVYIQQPRTLQLLNRNDRSRDACRNRIIYCNPHTSTNRNYTLRECEESCCQNNHVS
jgi:hypothetical protein